MGPAHYVQMVNSTLAIFDKAGTVLYGPVDINTLWGGFGGPCQNGNDGDPIVQYDGLSDRWLISQFSVRQTNTYECVAVSATSDPLGQYHRYAFGYGTVFPDYPKVGCGLTGTTSPTTCTGATPTPAAIRAVARPRQHRRHHLRAGAARHAHRGTCNPAVLQRPRCLLAAARRRRRPHPAASRITPTTSWA